ncbi:DUF6708 domain-containing protein [uncultured Gilliamella sp.]|uniref:DUF6708 domain-containing protein n=1 Tax=uncultured Gilliamella sp. TaxID=1193505 RepID=UPI0025DF9ECB|nr:DUF6708 domain-containing protein [uncultured Gilliamella sp.]
MPSKYQPQLSCWREDLYKGIYTTKLHLSNNKKLRFVNDDYCEFSRRLAGMNFYLRWILCLMLLFGVIASLFGVLFGLYFIIYSLGETSLSVLIGTTGLFILYFFLQVILNLFYAPDDCPIRLNRKTGKIYLYEHLILYTGTWKFLKNSPFKAKKITIKEFDWADIQGVVTCVSAPIAKGGVIRNYRLECVVCEPNTTYVIDHFLLVMSSILNYDEWMWINSYMAFSDENLDKKLKPEDEFSWPIKINWPEEIDKKSKASSLEEYQQIDDEYKKIKED